MADTPMHPPRVTVVIGTSRVTFVQIAAERYAAEVDGTRRNIRLRTRSRQVFEGGGSRDREPELSENDIANIDSLLRCLELGASPRLTEHSVELSATDNWGHFRQHTWYTVTITAGDPIEIDESIDVQDDSYY